MDGPYIIWYFENHLRRAFLETRAQARNEAPQKKPPEDQWNRRK